MQELDGPDVHATGGLGGHQHTQRTGQFACQHDLLLVATRQGRHRQADRRGADVELRDPLPGVLTYPAQLQAAAPGVLLDMVEHEVFCHRERADEAVALTILRHEPQTCLDGTGRIGVRGPSAVDANGSAGGQHRPEQGGRQLGLSIALHSCHAENLAASHLEGDVVDDDGTGVVGHGEVVHLQARGGGVRLRLVDDQLHGTSHHHLGQFGLGVVRMGLPDDPAAPDDGDVVGDLTHLAKLVGDEDDGTSLVAQHAHDGHELVDLLGGEHGGGLVEDEIFRVIGEGLEDLDALLDAHRQVLDDRVGVDVEVIAIRELGDLATGSPHRQHPGRDLLTPQDDVLGNGEDVDEHEVLVHHADTSSHGLPGIGKVLLRPIDEHLPLVGVEQAVEDVHEGRLAGPVLTEQTVDSPRNHVQVDVVIGCEGAESFGDPAQRQAGLQRGPESIVQWGRKALIGGSGHAFILPCPRSCGFPPGEGCPGAPGPGPRDGWGSITSGAGPPRRS